MVQSRKPSSLITTLVLLTLFLVNIANGIALYQPRALTVTRSSTTVDSSSKEDGSWINSSSFASMHSSSKTIELAAVANEDARIARLPSSSEQSGAMGTFCREFIKQCYRIALLDQSGEVEVSHSCQRNGNKRSTSFTYSCARGRETLTAQVLKALGKNFNTPLTETSHGTWVVTKIVEKVATAFETATTKIATTTDATITRTTYTQAIEVVVEKVPSTTITSTSTVLYTTSLTTTAIRTERAVATSTVTSTQTEVFIQEGKIPIAKVMIRDADPQGIHRRAPSTFCLAFKIACQNECSGSRVSSRRKSWVCDASQSPLYTLSCLCRNGKTQTQYALEAVAKDRRIASLTVLGTSTTYLTSTRTTTLLTEAVSTRRVTRTALIGSTSTLTTTSTATTGAETSFERVSFAVETNTKTTFVPTTTTTRTATRTVSTTTQLVSAETGYVHAFDADTGDDLGVIGMRPSVAPMMIFPPEASNAVSFMAVRDNPTGLYKLARTDDPTIAIVSYQPEVNPIFKPGTGAYSLTGYAKPADICGPAGSAPGPISPTSKWPCETFVFSPLALDSTPGATVDTVNLRPFYINPTGYYPLNHSGIWASWGISRRVQSVADRAILTFENPTLEIVWYNFRFPFTT